MEATVAQNPSPQKQITQFNTANRSGDAEVLQSFADAARTHNASLSLPVGPVSWLA